MTIGLILQPSRRFLEIIIICLYFQAVTCVTRGPDGRVLPTYGPEQKMPIDSRTIFKGELCPVCGTPDYTPYIAKDNEVRIVYHCSNNHRFGFEGGQSPHIRYTDLPAGAFEVEGLTRYVLERVTPKVDRRRVVPANLVKHDYDESMLVGRCAVCSSDDFHSYTDEDGAVVYKCVNGHYWQYEPGFANAIISEAS